MIYFYDGSKTAFLTLLWLAFDDEDPHATSGEYQLALGQETVFVQADAQKARAAEKRLLSFDKGCMKELDLLLRNGETGKDQAALDYFLLLAKKKQPVREMLAEDAVRIAMEHLRRVTFEIHRMHGFVRFIECASGALYAPISPVHDICDLLLPHFRARLRQFPFLIHDVARRKAAVYDGEHTFLAPLKEAEIVLSANEEAWQALWKRYYAAVNIPERERIKQMKGYMPVRYWKFMPEKQ